VSFVPVDEIDWIAAAGTYVTIHAGGKEYLLRESLNSLTGRLDPARFVRIHRSTVVNVDRIVELRPDVGGDCVVVVRNGTQLKMAKSRRPFLEERLMFGGRVIGDGERD
jgi:two-component system, LytTR family, response regulator